MLIKFDYKLRICVYFLILFNLIEQLECRKEDKLNLLNDNTDAKENANLQIKNDENQSPKAKYSLNKYFLIYNLIKSKPFKRSINQQTSSKLNSFNNFKSFKRNNQINTNLIDEQLTSSNSSLLSFLNLLSNLKRQQPTCNQLKQLWDTSINKLVDYFLTENNQLFTQSHLNQMNNPIYLALINLIDDKNQHLKILNYNQDYNHQLNNQNKDDHLFFNKFLNAKNPYLIQKLPGSRNGQSHYFGDFINNDHNKDSKFIPNPIDRHDHGLEIIEDGPTFMYSEDNNKPTDFWPSDAQLSKPVNKPEIRY